MSSEANRDDAEKSFELSKRFHSQGEFELSLKFAEKAVHLYSQAEEFSTWLSTLQVSAAGRPPPKEDPKDTKDSERKVEGEKPDNGKEETNTKTSQNDNKEYTREQVEDVKRFLKIDRNDYYAVLGIPRGTSDEGEIKKSYRKLALKFHPDKNNAPGAEEAFKNVSRAFSCLQDTQQRAQYDRFGTEDLGGMAGAGAHGGGGMRYRHQGQREVSPEELFNMFFGGAFGGGGGGGGFGDGGMEGVHIFQSGVPLGSMFAQAFQQGGGGHPFYQYQHQRRRQRAHPPPDTWLSMIMQFLPMILIAILVFLSGLMPSAKADSWEHVSLTRTSVYPHSYRTENLKIPFYGSVRFHTYFSKNTSARKNERRHYEDDVERRYVADLQKKCQEEDRIYNKKMVDAASDPEALEHLKSSTTNLRPSCEELTKLNTNKT